MNISVSPEAARAASATLRAPSKAGAIHAAARQILVPLEAGRRTDSSLLRAAMETAFGGSDADGAWDWKSAYEACEAATRAAGIEAIVLLPTRNDFNDDLIAIGGDGLRAALGPQVANGDLERFMSW